MLGAHIKISADANLGRVAIQRLIGIAAFGVAILGFPGAGSANGPLLDAFALAIEHFDPNHELGLEVDSAEVQFIRQALDMSREAIPEVASIHVPADWGTGDRLVPTMFGTLELVDPEENPNRRTLTPELKAVIAAEIGEDCRVEITTYESIVSKTNPRVRKTTLWTFDWHCSDGAAIEKCGNREIVSWLCSRGISKVVLVESSYKGRDRARLYLRYGRIVDLAFESKQLAADPLYQDLFGNYELRPRSNNMVLGSKSIELVADPEHSGFGGVVLKFNFGWGDCPSGCLGWHHWVFKYRAIGKKKGDRWPLYGGLREEGGDPLPEVYRQRLRCGAPAR